MFALLLHAPTLGYFFNGDDFVVLGNIEWSGSRAFLLDTLRLEDYVPSWRPLSAAVYTLEWELFGLNAMPWRVLALALHLTSMVLLYALVMRAGGKRVVAATAALLFGVSGAHYETVTYVTAFPHVLETLFILASLYVLLAYAQNRERSIGMFSLSVLLFALAFVTNESAVTKAPVLIAAYALFSQRWSWRRPLRLLIHAAPFAALAAAWLAFYARSSDDQIRFADGSWDTEVVSRFALYLSWLIYPVQTIPLEPDRLRWALAGVVAVVAMFSVVRGPQLARLAVLGVSASLLPFLPVEWTTSRYSYGATAFFAPLVALSGYAAYERVSAWHRNLRIPANILALTLVAVVAGLYGWQSYAHNARLGRDGERWRLLVNELRRNVPVIEPGTTIWIVDGPWTEPLSQYREVPSVPRALYGDGVAFDMPRSWYREHPPELERQIFLQWDGDGLRLTTKEDVLAGP